MDKTKPVTENRQDSSPAPRTVQQSGRKLPWSPPSMREARSHCSAMRRKAEAQSLSGGGRLDEAPRDPEEPYRASSAAVQRHPRQVHAHLPAVL